MPDAPSSSEPIVCSATPWFLWQRVVPFSLIPLLMAAWFYYDYKVGYPEKLAKYQEYQTYLKSGNAQDWPKYAAERGWEQKPDEMDERKVDEQLYWAVGAGVLGLVLAGYYLLNLPRKLTCDAVSFTPPGGPQIPFSDVVKIDRRPWKMKGLAKVYYQRGSGLKKAEIDDLRFKGADAILERLQANFTGEVLDLAEAEAPTEVATSADPVAELPPAKTE